MHYRQRRASCIPKAIRRRTASAILFFVSTTFLLMPQDSRGDTLDAWEGEYCPISKVCAGSPLAIHPSAFSYFDCVDARLDVVTGTQAALLFKVDDQAKCSMSGNILSLRKTGQKDVRLRVYDNEGALRAQTFSLECTYRARHD
jgi:hypothetical protein